MNIYKKQIAACIKGIGRIDEYLKRLNFAAESYNAVKTLAQKQIKYKELDQAYRDYLDCNSQILSKFRDLHQTHNQEQRNNKGETNGN